MVLRSVEVLIGRSLLLLTISKTERRAAKCCATCKHWECAGNGFGECVVFPRWRRETKELGT